MRFSFYWAAAVNETVGTFSLCRLEQTAGLLFVFEIIYGTQPT